MHRYALRVVVLSLMFAASAMAQERSVWKIGAFDDSSAEFGGQSSTACVFIVNESQTKDWGATQQAVLPDKVGEVAPRKIQFELPFTPRGTYRLKLGLIMNTPRIPLAEACNAVEECGQPVSSEADGFSFEMRPRQIFTMKVKTVVGP